MTWSLVNLLCSDRSEVWRLAGGGVWAGKCASVAADRSSQQRRGASAHPQRQRISSTPVTVWLDSDINKVYIPSETCSMISVWMCVSCRPVRWTLTRPTVWWRSCLIRYQETTRARTPRSSKTAGPRTSSHWCLWIRVCLLCHIITLIYRASFQGKLINWLDQ